MVNLTINSFWLLLLLLSGPALFNIKKLRLRSWLFLLINIGLYLSCIRSLEGFLAIVIFVTLPLALIRLVQKKFLPLWSAISIVIILFIYINNYSWLLSLIPGSSRFLFSAKILGLSYILFRVIDVMVHARAGLIKKINLFEYFNYLFSFYTILAGPIQRYRDFLSFFYSVKLPDERQALRYLHRAAGGMLKILVLAVLMKSVSDTAYLRLLENGFSLKRLAAIFYTYPLYVYFNFSGYCDVVIAMAGWAGFALPENFDRPYLARNMIEFWNRWHITLSQWLRDFVYQPFFKFLLSGIFSKHILIAQYLSIFVTFFLVGVWHGTAINFVVFGLLHGIGMVVSMVYRDIITKLLSKEAFRKYKSNSIIAFTEILVCAHFVCFTFLFFEYDIKNMFFWLKNLIP